MVVFGGISTPVKFPSSSLSFALSDGEVKSFLEGEGNDGIASDEMEGTCMYIVL